MAEAYNVLSGHLLHAVPPPRNTPSGRWGLYLGTGHDVCQLADSVGLDNLLGALVGRNRRTSHASC